MGQSSSTPSSSSLSSSRSTTTPTTPPVLMPPPPPPPPLSLPSYQPPPRDLTLDVPDDCLALIFHSLPTSDRNSCSLVCRRWLRVESSSRHRLSLDARASLLHAAPSLLSRFHSVSKLALKSSSSSSSSSSDHHHHHHHNRRNSNNNNTNANNNTSHHHEGSIPDEALLLILPRCPLLSRLKLRSCRLLTPLSLSSLPVHCPHLRKLSCSSCSFGLAGLAAVVSHCPLLQELSVKRLRGLDFSNNCPDALSGNPSLRTVSLKELYNGQSLAPILAGSPNLKTLKLFRCAGDWDAVLVEVASKVPGLVEVHLEKLQVSDRGLEALYSCANLEILHLVKTPECTDRGLSSVADSCRLLRKIHIDGWKTNRIGDAGLSAVARRCPNLQELVLIGVNPTSASLSLIADNCKSLERLALCSSETFGDAEISCVAARCVALRKLCIKGCPVSDQGMEALAGGCPNLVKVKVKKCRGVTAEGADWLRSSRGSLAVNLDMDAAANAAQEAAANAAAAEVVDGSASENGSAQEGNEMVPPMQGENDAVASSSNGNGAKSGRRAWVRRNFVMALRRWYHSAGGGGGGGGSGQQQPSST